jgi:hypothetical protein
MTKNGEAHLQRCWDRNGLLRATAMSRGSSNGPPPVRALCLLRRRGERMVIFRKLGNQVVLRVGRVRSYQSNLQDHVLLWHSGIILCLASTGDMVMSPVQRLQWWWWGGYFWNMTVPRAGTWNRVSAGTAHVKGPITMAC